MDSSNGDRFERSLLAWGRMAVAGMVLSGGNRNDVREVRVAGARFAGRRSRRRGPSLDWELDLLDHLRAAGVRVPRVLPALDGRREVDGLVLLEWLDGDRPSSAADWRRVADALRRVHALGRDWPQRPGFRSTQELLGEERGGDVRLDLMPPAAVRRCREAWRTLAEEPVSVVHDDPGTQNIAIAPHGVGLFDWDEARVDVSLLDLAEVPLPPVDLGVPAERAAVARHAANAWEAANGWLLEPEYARRRLSGV